MATDFGHADLAAAYEAVRRFTVDLCAPLTPEDCAAQSMPDASPVKWHLGHTTWFFESFALLATGAATRPYDPAYAYIFNSYYEAVGPRQPRAQRGLLTRPTLAEVLRYRQRIDELVLARLLSPSAPRLDPGLESVLVLGLEHERQHQELMLTDVKHLFASQPLRPAYRPLAHAKPPSLPDGAVANGRAAGGGEPPEPELVPFDGGLLQFGHDGRGFSFDNERPRHRVFLQPFALADRLVTNGEYRRFIEDGGYLRPELWLSDGWRAVCEEGWSCPLYWEERGGDYCQMTLAGPKPLDPAEPVVHVSYYEADAFARWRGARLPTEYEWELAARSSPVEGNFVESGRLHPAAAAAPSGDGSNGRCRQLFGDVWEWTASPYAPYPGFRPMPGPLGEYNGKFMCNQLVLRGGSCVTSRAHARATYRNFFAPGARWQFTGFRLAEDRA